MGLGTFAECDGCGKMQPVAETMKLPAGWARLLREAPEMLLCVMCHDAVKVALKNRKELSATTVASAP